jgi:type IV pilus assembly protein PilM
MRIADAVNRWLPPPALLRIGGTGVDISESSIKYIGFEPSYAGMFALTLTEHGEVELGANVLSKGEIKDVQALAAGLAEVKRRTGNPYMHISLPEERVYLFETDIETRAAGDEIRQQIEFRLEENVPLSPRDAYFDFRLSNETSANDGQQRVVVTVCAKEVVDAYYEACRIAKVVPLSFEVESAAIARSVLPKGDRGTRVLLDFGRTRAGFGIVHHGELIYTSTIDFGGNDLSAALKRHLGERPENELTTLKNEFGLVKSHNEKDVAEVLLPVVSVVKDELQTRVEYWNGRNADARPIDHVIVCGGSANLRGLTSYLSETLGIEASLANVWQNAFDPKLLAPAIDRRHSYGYATAVGLALSSFSDL